MLQRIDRNLGVELNAIILGALSYHAGCHRQRFSFFRVRSTPSRLEGPISERTTSRKTLHIDVRAGREDPLAVPAK